MEKYSSNNLFKETLLSSNVLNKNNKNNTSEETFLKTVPTTEINNIIKDIKKDDIVEIFDKYNELKKKINALLNDLE